MTGAPAPVVVLVGPGLDGVEQVAASVRRHGVRSAWVGYPYGLRRVARARLFTDVATSATDVPTLADALHRIGPDRVVDVICSELVVGDAHRAAVLAGVPEAVVAELARRLRWVDKVEVSRAAGAAGVAVPPIALATEVSPEVAAARLGLPLVVKARVGMAGQGVRIVPGADAARRAVAELGGERETYYEKLIRGTDHSWVAAYRSDGTLVQDGSYVAERTTADTTGPPDRVRPVDRPGQRAAGAALLRVMGGRGLVNMDFVVDEAGRDWLLDVNPRPWHSTVAFRALGVDFVAAYLQTLDLLPARPPDRWPVGGRLEVYPFVAAHALARRPLPALRDLVLQSRAYLPWTGPGYVAASWLRAAGTAGAALLPRRPHP